MTRGYLSPRSSAAAHKASVASAVADNLNPIKSDLIRQLRRLEEAGADRAAESLSRIIFRLEAWQGRNA